MVIVIGIASLSLALYSSASLVSLLLIGYAGVAQLIPGRESWVSYWKRVTTLGVFCGLVAGIVAAVFFDDDASGPDFLELNAGFAAALCVNLAVAVSISWAKPAAAANLRGRRAA